MICHCRFFCSLVFIYDSPGHFQILGVHHLKLLMEQFPAFLAERKLELKIVEIITLLNECHLVFEVLNAALFLRILNQVLKAYVDFEALHCFG